MYRERGVECVHERLAMHIAVRPTHAYLHACTFGTDHDPPPHTHTPHPTRTHKHTHAPVDTNTRAARTVDQTPT